MKLIGKSKNTVKLELRRCGYTDFLWIEESSALEAGMNAAGIGVKSCAVKFSPKGRAISFEEKIW